MSKLFFDKVSLLYYKKILIDCISEILSHIIEDDIYTIIQRSKDKIKNGMPAVESVKLLLHVRVNEIKKNPRILIDNMSRYDSKLQSLISLIDALNKIYVRIYSSYNIHEHKKICVEEMYLETVILVYRKLYTHIYLFDTCDKNKYKNIKNKNKILDLIYKYTKKSVKVCAMKIFLYISSKEYINDLININIDENNSISIPREKLLDILNKNNITPSMATPSTATATSAVSTGSFDKYKTNLSDLLSGKLSANKKKIDDDTPPDNRSSDDPIVRYNLRK